MKKSVKILSLIAIMLLAIVGKSQAQIVAYDLWVNGELVTSANAANVLAGTSNDHRVVYNDAQKTLYLNSANLTAGTDIVPLGFSTATSPNKAVIVSNIEGLIIQLSGNNTITYNNTNGYGVGVYLHKPMTIQGAGKLDLNVTAQLSSFGINGNSDLTIKDVAINIINSGRGIQAWHKALTVNDAKLEIATNGEAIVCADLTISTSKIKEGDTKATASAVSALTRTTINSATMGSKNYVSIDPGYKLWIAGHRVFEGQSMITGAGITGSVKYDHATKTLALDRAAITNTNGAGIVIGRSYLELVKKIVITGNNTIKGVDESGISYGTYLQGDALTISGDNTASLDIIADATTLSAGSPILIEDYAGVTIEGGCKVKLSDGIDGGASIDVDGTASGREVLTVNGSRLELASINSAIEIELLGGVKILSPSDVKLENKTLKDPAGNTYSGAVIFGLQTYKLWINGRQVDDGNKNNISGDGITGSVKYDPTTKTLTMDNATISQKETGDDPIVIEDNLTINIIGKNSIWSEEGRVAKNAAIFIRDSDSPSTLLRIFGDKNAEISISASNDDNVGAANAIQSAPNAVQLLFEVKGGCKVELSSTSRTDDYPAIYCNDNAANAVDITVENSTLILEKLGDMTTKVAFSTLSNVSVIEPIGSTLDQYKRLMKDGKLYEGKVVIGKSIPVTGITIEPKTVNLTVGGTATVTATVAPANATNKSVTWTSSDEAIATVDATGKITAKAIGAAVIIATTVDGGKTATCNLTVSASVVAVTGVSISPTSLEITYGESKTLTAIIAPENATNKNVTWKTNDPVIATVDANGKVTGLAVGIAVITVTTVDGGKTAFCNVTVTDGTSVEEMRNNGINIWAADAAININIKDAKIAINGIQVFDINGNEVFSKLNPSENLRVELVSGVYFVRIGELIQKVVLVK